ncbi:hypothetical protein [Glaciibacter superstes]|uniref:hypothetical protein n=1 Tax=Glaciibacter superstes TaxID=501023 RepID=UPI0003B48FB9|nr:hypothetical protein [Glaciibacter superstes]
MADPLVIHADLDLFLVGWYRRALAARPEAVCRNVVVDIRESNAARQLIVRADGGVDTSIISAERDVGLSILAGTVENPKDANDLANIVHALRTQIPAVEPGNPVTAVLRSSGPLPVPESQEKARRYITLTLAVAGTPL